MTTPTQHPTDSGDKKLEDFLDEVAIEHKPSWKNNPYPFAAFSSWPSNEKYVKTVELEAWKRFHAYTVEQKDKEAKIYIDEFKAIKEYFQKSVQESEILQKEITSLKEQLEEAKKTNKDALQIIKAISSASVEVLKNITPSSKQDKEAINLLIEKLNI